ncbi:MAG: SRPBCC family protein [Leptospirales bacterium]
MARDIETTIDIHAPVADIWRILTDLPRYLEWNPLVIRASGSLTVGKRLEVAVRLPGRRPMSFSPILIALFPQREFCWIGTLGISALFAGEHSFRLIPQSHGATRFIHSERFTGALPSLMGRQWYERVRQGFESMNHALKERAERHVA